MASKFDDVILWRHHFFKILGFFDVTLCPEKKSLLKKFKHMLIFNVLSFRKSKQNLIIFNKYPRNRFSKLSVFWQNYWFLKFFDDVSKKWQPFWIFFLLHFVPFVNNNKCGKFRDHCISSLENLEGGADSAPPSVTMNVLKKDVILRVTAYWNLLFFEDRRDTAEI